MRAAIVTLLGTLLILTTGHASQDIRAEIIPPSPVAGETFHLVLRIPILAGGEEPFISFDSKGLQVLQREVRVPVHFAGRIREYDYHLQSDKAGYAGIRNIIIEQGQTKTKLPSISLHILQEKARAPEVFLLAIPSKKTVFMGEGLDVGYYLYYAISIERHLVKEYPKFEKFHRRDRDVSTTKDETVDFEGTVYKRLLMYAVRLYPEKVGMSSIDSLRMKVEYRPMGHRGGIGFASSSAERIEKDIQSPRVNIEVVPLPAENVPTDFTGLVGEHRFTLMLPQAPSAVNEPIEIKLAVEGPGALEGLQAPKLYQHSALEEFDTKSDLQSQGDHGRKTFEYTYLGRSPFVIPERELRFSYFDLESQTYRSKSLMLPRLIVGTPDQNHASQAGASTPVAPVQANTPEGQGIRPPSPVKMKSGFLAPDFYVRPVVHSWIFYLNILLGVLTALLLLSFIRMPKEDKIYTQARAQIRQLCRRGLNYAPLYRLFSLLERGDAGPEGQLPLAGIIASSSLSREAKDYFGQLAQWSQENSYNRQEHKWRYRRKYFKELLTIIRARGQQEIDE